MAEAVHNTWDAALYLNPASEPWFPTDLEIDWSSYNIPDPAYDPNLVFPQEFLAFPAYLPPVNYYLEPKVHYEPVAAVDVSCDTGLKHIKSIVTDILQVKVELKAKVQQLTR
jgi:hypothetical protein